MHMECTVRSFFLSRNAIDLNFQNYILGGIFMDMKATFVATLLGCTMLAGCNGSDKKADSASNAQSTFATATDLNALKRDGASAAAALAQAQKALEALQSKADADHRKTIALTLWR